MARRRLCARGRVRPDGYGLYRHAGRLYGFFLEYDRGTMRAGEYRTKFAAYHDASATGRFERDYDGLPTILVVTSGPGPERRIAGAIAACGVGRDPPLPVLLLTTTGRVESDRRGLLGPIWRETRAAGVPLAGAGRPSFPVGFRAAAGGAPGGAVKLSRGRRRARRRAAIAAPAARARARASGERAAFGRLEVAGAQGARRGGGRLPAAKRRGRRPA